MTMSMLAIMICRTIISQTVDLEWTAFAILAIFEEQSPIRKSAPCWSEYLYFALVDAGLGEQEVFPAEEKVWQPVALARSRLVGSPLHLRHILQDAIPSVHQQQVYFTLIPYRIVLNSLICVTFDICDIQGVLFYRFPQLICVCWVQVN